MYIFLVLVSAVERSNSLRHFGKKEILTKNDLMEDQYDQPMMFDESLIPSQAPPVAAGEDHASWGYGVAMFHAAWATEGMW